MADPTNTTLTHDAHAQILRRMLRKRAADNKQLTSEELVQVVPSDQQDETKDALQDLHRDPNSPIISPGGHRDVYTLRSLEEAATKLESLTGERIDYRSNTHNLNTPDEIQNITLQLGWDTVNTVKHALEQTITTATYEIDYETHPPTLSVTGTNEELTSLRPHLRDATNGTVDW